jgi:CheY-like chemotaxis protein
MPIDPPVHLIRVLVVDDDPSMLDLYKHSLSKFASAVAVMSAEEAIVIITAGATFDVVLCDLELDGMSGRELLKFLLVHSPAHASRMVIVSGTPASEADENFLRVLGDRWLEKPAKPFVLQAIVESVARRAA